MQAVTKLAELARDVGFAAGDSLTGPDSVPSTVYLVIAGTVEVRHRSEPRLSARFGASEVVFIDAAITSVLPEYEVVAVTEAIVLLLDLDDLLDVMEEHIDVVRSTLVSMTDEFEQLLKQALENGQGRLEGAMFKTYRRP
jgi:CRP-like cAMP-binding protein